jgi:hypothetical protein
VILCEHADETVHAPRFGQQALKQCEKKEAGEDAVQHLNSQDVQRCSGAVRDRPVIGQVRPVEALIGSENVTITVSCVAPPSILATGGPDVGRNYAESEVGAGSAAELIVHPHSVRRVARESQRP